MVSVIVLYQAGNSMSHLDASHAFDHFARSYIHDTLLQPPAQEAIEKTPESSPNRHGDDPEHSRSPAPSRPALPPMHTIPFVNPRGRSDRTEWEKDDGREGNRQGAQVAGESSDEGHSPVGSGGNCSQIPRRDQARMAVGENAELGGESVCRHCCVIADRSAGSLGCRESCIPDDADHQQIISIWPAFSHGGIGGPSPQLLVVQQDEQRCDDGVGEHLDMGTG